jgi:hypothetical protein
VQILEHDWVRQCSVCPKQMRVVPSSSILSTYLAGVVCFYQLLLTSTRESARRLEVCVCMCKGMAAVLWPFIDIPHTSQFREKMMVQWDNTLRSVSLEEELRSTLRAAWKALVR